MLKKAIYLRLCVLLLLFTAFCLKACQHQSNASSAFYYWKGTYELSPEQTRILEQTASKRLYLRFMDVKWNSSTKQLSPEAVIRFRDSIGKTAVTPVIFITNQSFEKIKIEETDSLAFYLNKISQQLAAAQHLNYESMQIDCDWTVSTREKYFRFLSQLKKFSHKKLEATIRLHQVKYHFRTGIPPVDRGILMFYNMGKLSADLSSRNSIYNEEDAAPYISYLSSYKLPLDVALPLFSWSLHIRHGKLIQIYGKIGKTALSNRENFEPTEHKNVFKARKSFFLSGVYVKTNDLFKLEAVDSELLTTAAKQLAPKLHNNEKRNIIYYELGNLDLSSFKAKDLQKTSAYF